ncbi:MAG: c-type cytochrome [Bacteroidota bacterium]
MNKLRWLVFVALSGTLVLATTALARAAPPQQDAATGEKIFNTMCTSCHTIGKGKLVGPDLKGVTQRRDAAWLTSWIKAPDKVLASGDPTATKLLAENNNLPMPNLGLSDADVASLVAYLQKMDGGAPTAATSAPGKTQAAPAATQPAGGATQAAPAQPGGGLAGTSLVLAMNGNPAIGEKIFRGQVRLQNGGTQCIACHTVEGVGAFGGGALGPNLTHVYTRYGGAAGLAAVLGTLPFPTMQGVFAARLPTVSEQADLLAFFAQADQRVEVLNQQRTWILLGIGTALTALLLLGMVFTWPRQRMGIAQRLRKDGRL